MEKVFAIHKDEKVTQRRTEVWVVEPQGGDGGEKSVYSSRTKAIVALLRKYPVIVFTSPNREYTLEKAKGKYTLRSSDEGTILENATLLYAVRILLSKQPDGIEEFYISIPENAQSREGE